MATSACERLSAVQQIFENIIFLEQIFADRSEEEIPNVPVLELAKSFHLKD